MSVFRIEGGIPLHGRVRVSGNKNEALPAVAAALLTDEPVTLHNVPAIVDVQVMLDVLVALGADVATPQPGTVRIQCKDLRTTAIPARLGERVRASILFAGPLLARAGRCELPPPGGDVIGRRRLDTHMDGLVAMGASLAVGTELRLDAPQGLHGADLFLDEASVTATENLLMAASLARGVTTIQNGACEPHVQGLAALLRAMGADIAGVGTHQLTIAGVDRLHGAEHTIGPDYMETGSFIGLAAVTGSELRIEDAAPQHLRMIRATFARLGVHTVVDGADVLVPGGQTLAVKRDLGAGIPKVDDAPWPQFPTDLMSIAITTATQAHGTVLFFEKMFEGRMFFVDSLIQLGAQIILCDPHRVVVVGPAQLYGGRVSSPDVRAGMALLIAALCAKGTSRIANIRQIDRGYDRIEQKLLQLGARIVREDEP